MKGRKWAGGMAATLGGTLGIYLSGDERKEPKGLWHPGSGTSEAEGQPASLSSGPERVSKVALLKLLILSLRRLRQRHFCELRASLNYIESPCQQANKQTITKHKPQHGLAGCSGKGRVSAGPGFES